MPTARPCSASPAAYGVSGSAMQPSATQGRRAPPRPHRAACSACAASRRYRRRARGLDRCANGRMQAPRRAEPFGQPVLDRGLAVLVLEVMRTAAACSAPMAASASRIAARSSCDRSPVGEHLRVGDRGPNVVFDQPVVQDEIVAGRVGEHPRIERNPCPEPVIGLRCACCSAGLRPSSRHHQLPVLRS